MDHMKLIHYHNLYKANKFDFPRKERREYKFLMSYS